MVTKPSAPAPSHKAVSTKKEFLLFISIPAGIILLVALLMVVPSLLARPTYDFLYSNCPSYDCFGSFIVNKDGHVKLVDDSSNDLYSNRQEMAIYYHDTSSNASRRIDLTEADSYRLNPSNVSPDGYTLTAASDSGGGFLFWGYYGDSGSWQLKKGSLVKTKSLNLDVRGYSSNNVKLIGWVEK